MESHITTEEIRSAMREVLARRDLRDRSEVDAAIRRALEGAGEITNVMIVLSDRARAARVRLYGRVPPIEEIVDVAKEKEAKA